MPISGTAKQLRLSHIPDLTAIKIAFRGTWPPVLALSRPVTLGILISLSLLLFGGRGRLAAQHRPLVLALMFFPVLQLSVLSLLSDWPIWEWYFYPFVCAAIGVTLVLATRSEAWLAFAERVAVPTAGLLALGLLTKISVHDLRAATKPDLPMYDFYYAANDLTHFADTHPGIYAMGDRAGLAGYKMKSPLVQLEGLMMDKPFLENIKERRNLLSVLDRYNVRYYVATDLHWTPDSEHACFSAREPIQAGPTSPTMTGMICRPPVGQFRYHGIQNYIFDLRAR